MISTSKTGTHDLPSLVQSWNITYRGNDDLYAFLRKVESKAENAKVSLNSLVSVIPQLLTGPAQQWFEVQGATITTWEEFREEITSFFLPSRFLAQIENNYYSRKQRPREKARDFILDLLTLAKQHPELKTKNHLERLYDGLLPEYRLQISRSSISNISELSCKCNEYEQLRHEEARTHRNEEQRRHEGRNQPTNHMIQAYSRETHCWRCKQQGHQRFQCRNPPLLFCSKCGKEGVLSTQCCRERKQITVHTTNNISALPANRIFAKINIKKLTINALIDTGASQSYISTEMIPQLKKADFHLEKYSTSIQVANQAFVQTEHRVYLPITIHNKTTWQYALIMPDLAETMILGMDFLKQRNFSLQIDEKALTPVKHKNPAKLHTLISQDELVENQKQNLVPFVNEQESTFILHYPNITSPFILQTDANSQGLGAVLFQRHSDQERVIAYASRTLNSAEKNYTTTEQKCLAILWGIRKMRPYLEGYHFTVITDHPSLKWLHQFKNPTGRLARLASKMQQYDFNVEYRKGTSNVVADALSRSPLTETQSDTLFAIGDVPSNDWYKKKIKIVENQPQEFSDCQLVDGRLFHHIARKNPLSPDPEWKLCVPNCKQSDVLREIHDFSAAGHLGITKTLQRAQQSYYWPGMYRDLYNYVKGCRCCNHYKPSQQKPAGWMTTMQYTHPWEVVCADFVGPLPKSSSGNTCLLVLVDKFSKWVELFPVRQATAKTIVYALREKIIYRFGCPQVLLSDSGCQFMGGELKQFVQGHGIEHRFTAPYSPQENAAERTNRVVKTMISQLCDHSPRDWNNMLPEIASVIITAIHESTKHSATQIIYCRAPDGPNKILNESCVPTEETIVNDVSQTHTPNATRQNTTVRSRSCSGCGTNCTVHTTSGSDGTSTAIGTNKPSCASPYTSTQAHPTPQRCLNERHHTTTTGTHLSADHQKPNKTNAHNRINNKRNNVHDNNSNYNNKASLTCKGHNKIIDLTI